jgi:hypothetical protein
MLGTEAKNRISKKHRNIVLIAVAAFLLLVFTRIYIAEPIEGWAIDAETKKPVEGVVVVAMWQLYRGHIAGRNPTGMLKVLETVTDKDGRFFYPGWGPKVTWSGYLDWEDPALIFFKSGYRYRWEANPLYSQVNQSIVRRSVWNGKKIELQKFKGSQQDYAKHLSILGTAMHSIMARDDCMWKKIPKLVLAVNHQKKIFQKLDIYSSIYSLDTLPTENCGSPKDYFSRYEK